MSVPFLPEEIWDLIVQSVSQADRKRLRLSCKLLARIATPHLFQTVRFELTDSGCSSLIRIGLHTGLSVCVRRLILRRARGPRTFPNFYVWKQSVDLCGSVSRGPLVYSNIDADRDSGSVALYGWSALSQVQKRALFCQYNADRSAMLESTVPFIAELSNVLQEHGKNDMTAGNCKMAARLLKAVACLVNLMSLEHEPKLSPARHCGLLQWRGLRFRLVAFRAHTIPDEDKDLDAMQLTTTLCLLAKVGRGSPSRCLEGSVQETSILGISTVGDPTRC